MPSGSAQQKSIQVKFAIMQSKGLVKVVLKGISEFILHSRGADLGSHSRVECTHYTCCNHCTLYC